MQRGRGEGKAYRKYLGRHEHRVVAEQKIGRALLPGEVVHHWDTNKLNNDPRNLAVLVSQSEHARLESTGRIHSPESKEKMSKSRKAYWERKHGGN